MTGEALVSVLDEKGVPTIVQRTGILPPRSSMNPADPETMQEIIKNSRFYKKYAETVDRESAYEAIVNAEEELEEVAETEVEEENTLSKSKKETKESPAKKKSSNKSNTLTKKAVNSAASSFGRSFGSKIARGILDVFKF